MLRSLWIVGGLLLVAVTGTAGCGLFSSSGGGGGGAIGPQTGQISVDLNTLAVTVVTQPTHLELIPQGDSIVSTRVAILQKKARA